LNLFPVDFLLDLSDVIYVIFCERRSFLLESSREVFLIFKGHLLDRSRQSALGSGFVRELIGLWVPIAWSFSAVLRGSVICLPADSEPTRTSRRGQKGNMDAARLILCTL